MDSFTSLLNFLEIPTTVLKELINFYKHCINDHKETCDIDCTINSETKMFLSNCLTKNPLETNSIIENLLQVYYKKHKNPFTDLMALISNVIIDNLQQISCDEVEQKNIYSLLSLLEYSNNQQMIFQLLYELIENEKISKDFVYITLLPQQNLQILKQFVEYEKSNFNRCNILDTTSLFRFCLYKNKHWLFNILNHEFDEKINKNIMKKLFILKLKYVTNNQQIDFVETRDIISQLNKFHINDQFLKYYIAVIKWNLEMHNFVCKLNPDKMNQFNTIYLQSCVDILSLFIDLKTIDKTKYTEINQLLIKHENYLSELNSIRNNDVTLNTDNYLSELDAYNGLCLIITIKNYILQNNNDEIEELIKIIKHQLFQSTNLDFLLEILENVFTLIFLQNKHFGLTNEDCFLCGYKEILFIATFLNDILVKMYRKYFSKREKTKPFLRYSNFSSLIRILKGKLNIFKKENILKNDKETINFLVSPPETLIYYCLEKDNIQLAQNVVSVCKISHTEIASDLEYTEKTQYLKDDKTWDELIKYCSEQKQRSSNISGESIAKFENTKNNVFMNLMDVVLTVDENYETSKKLIDKAFEHITTYPETCDYLKFCQNIREIFDKHGYENNLSVPQILTNTTYPLDIIKMREKEDYFNQIEINYNQFQEKIITDNCEQIYQQQNQVYFQQISELCDTKLNDFNYLKKVLNYLKKLTEILYIKTDNSNVIMRGKENCVLNLISLKTAEIVGQLLLEHNLKPKDFEKLFAKLKLDIVYKISWNFLPEIELNIREDNYCTTLGECEDLRDIIKQLKLIYNINETKKIENTPDIFLLSYIQKRNWLLAYLMNKIYSKEDKEDINSDQTKYFNNLLSVQSIKKLKLMFDGNATIAVLYNNEMHFAKLLEFIEREEKNWEFILELICGIPETLALNNKDLIRIKDLVIYNIISSTSTTSNNKLIELIDDNALRLKCILECLQKWPGQFCIKILKCELSRWDLDVEHEEIIKKKYYQIDLYENIKNSFNLKSWNEVYEKSTNEPKEIFLLLLTSKQVELLLKWIKIHKAASIELLQLITLNYFKLLLDNNTNLQQIKTLLDLLQFDQRVAICKNLLKQLKICEYDFIVKYLVSLLPELESEYKNTIISLRIFSCFNANEHEHMFCLMHKPSLIIEQLIMNVRLEKLYVILEEIKPIVRDAIERKIPVDVTVESVDELLRSYAKKALDFRGIQPSAEMKNLELKLMQSLDTVSVDSERKSFVIPDRVPDKSDWVQNEQALECMCCRDVIFSMFNRRHHCRRCGRVVCGNCSLKKMEIPEYGSIPVRVCNDCLKQSQSDETNVMNKSEQSSSKSGSLTCWLLTDDEKHNEIAREEFSFEYAPSVSLCLSILKAHSNNIEYPRFLLDQCRILLPYLQDGISEIDFSFVIQMIKSLVTVAKLSSLNNSFKSELMECNEILLQIELMNLLVEKDCLELLRSSMRHSGDDYNHSRVLRRLRDKLIEREQWALALDVSTKVGLDKTGIFAAWGKSHLKAGALQMARDKFQYCLEKSNTLFDSDLSVSVSVSGGWEDDRKGHKSLNLSTVSENRPAKTPPLINEIINVLEGNDAIADRSLFRQSLLRSVTLNTSTLSLNSSTLTLNDPAVCILNKLKGLKQLTADAPNARSRRASKVSVERFTSTAARNNKMEPCFYNECLYYLMKYASHSSILHFYVRHEELHEALTYILENRLQNEYFVEIYMKCLEENKIQVFQETLHKIDCTLDSWETYLKAICRHLETNQMFNVLYQLQLFMCDYVRAAMTCIRFYQENANNFRELLGREEYLHKAQNHLKQELEHEQWVKVTPVRKSSTASSSSSSNSKTSNNPSLTMKIDPRHIDRYINTIWRQIEVSKFLAECEIENRPTLDILPEIFTNDQKKNATIPCLFETQLEKTKLAVMAVVCGKNIEEGFGIAFRIIQDHNLKYLKIYCLAGKYLASILQDSAVVQLINCIKSSGLNMETVNETCDDVLMVAVNALVKANASGAQLENIIKLINDAGNKVDAYIECKQLKRAYLLAIKYNKISDIKKILREAERQNQPQIKAICLKRLNQTK